MRDIDERKREFYPIKEACLLFYIWVNCVLCLGGARGVCWGIKPGEWEGVFSRERFFGSLKVNFLKMFE